MDKKVTLAQLKEVVQEAYDQVKANTGGKNADYGLRRTITFKESKLWDLH